MGEQISEQNITPSMLIKETVANVNRRTSLYLKVEMKSWLLLAWEKWNYYSVYIEKMPHPATDPYKKMKELPMLEIAFNIGPKLSVSLFAAMYALAKSRGSY